MHTSQKHPNRYPLGSRTPTPTPTPSASWSGYISESSQESRVSRTFQKKKKKIGNWVKKGFLPLVREILSSVDPVCSFQEDLGLTGH